MAPSIQKGEAGSPLNAFNEASGGSIFYGRVRRSKHLETRDVKTKAKAPPSSYKPKNFHLDKRAGTLLEVEAKADDEELIDTKTLSAWIGTTAQWLTIARSGGYGPPFIRVAARRVVTAAEPFEPGSRNEPFTPPKSTCDGAG